MKIKLESITTRNTKFTEWESTDEYVGEKKLENQFFKLSNITDQRTITKISNQISTKLDASTNEIKHSTGTIKVTYSGLASVELIIKSKEPQIIVEVPPSIPDIFFKAPIELFTEEDLPTITSTSITAPKSPETASTTSFVQQALSLEEKMNKKFGTHLPSQKKPTTDKEEKPRQIINLEENTDEKLTDAETTEFINKFREAVNSTAAQEQREKLVINTCKKNGWRQVNPPLPPEKDNKKRKIK